MAARPASGHVVAIDRSARAVAQARAACAAEIAAGRLTVPHTAVEDLDPATGPFDVVFAARVGALDGRHPGQRAWAAIAAVLAPGGRVFVDGREVPPGAPANGPDGS
ncbi:MAG: methyltransferase domain-containing protein [Pseudonocardia sp.]